MKLRLSTLLTVLFIIALSTGAQGQHRSATDSVIVLSDRKNIDKYSKKDLAKIVSDFPDLDRAVPDSPDSSYAKAVRLRQQTLRSARKDDEISFISEAGQDEYYVLYAYFLKQKNKEEKIPKIRNSTILEMEYINRVYSILSSGGTGFGHMSFRILAYAEYAIYLHNNNKDIERTSRSFEQKKRDYLNTLRARVRKQVNEGAFGGWTKDGAKVQTQKVLQVINQIGHLITSDFYLETAIRFENNHYYS